MRLRLDLTRSRYRARLGSVAGRARVCGHAASDVNGDYSLAIFAQAGARILEIVDVCDPDHSGVIQITAARAKL